MRAVSATLTFFAFSFAAIVAYFASNLAVRWVEKISVSAIEELITIEGHEWASVQADGLHVILEGEAPSEAARFKVLAAAGSIVEAARVIDSFTITAAVELEAPEFSVEILRNAAGISIIGLIPASDSIDDTLKIISKIAADLPVTNFLETADYPKPPSWSAAMSFALLALERLNRSKISVTKERVHIQAIGNSVAQKNKARVRA
jgi:OOP family OmpA-OmpF porin